MAAKELCKVKACPREANGPGAARGFCARHYRQDQRGRLGKTRERAAPGEGEEITFRLPAPEKAALEKAVRELRAPGGIFAEVTVSDLCRLAVRRLLADRSTNRR